MPTGPAMQCFSLRHFAGGSVHSAPMSQRVIAFHYTLTDKAGKTLDSSASGEPLAFIVGSGQIIPGLETHLLTMKVGDKRRVLVPAKDAYGAKDPANTTEMPLDQMPAKGIQVGDRFRAGADDHAPVVTVARLPAPT